MARPEGSGRVRDFVEGPLVASLNTASVLSVLVSSEAGHRGSAGWVLIGLALIGVALLLHSLAIRISQRRRDRTASLLLELPTRPSKRFLLFLRPFFVTGRMITKKGFKAFNKGYSSIKNREKAELETFLTSTREKGAPLVALGEPGEHYGAGRVKVSDDAWKQTVADLAGSAALILTIPSSRPGTAWELAWLKHNRLLKKTVFIRVQSVCLQRADFPNSLPLKVLRRVLSRAYSA